MSPEALTVAGVVLAALLGLIGVLMGQLYARINRLEDAVRAAEKATERQRSYNRRMWLWARRHIDLYYRHRTAGSPDPEPIPAEAEDDDEG